MSRRNFIKSVLGLSFLPFITNAQTLKPLSQNNKILLQTSPLAGFQYHQGEIIWPQLKIGDALTLQREPQNQRDSHAIAVYWNQSKLGYVPRRENRTLAQMLDREQNLQAQIQQLQYSGSPWQR